MVKQSLLMLTALLSISQIIASDNSTSRSYDHDSLIERMDSITNDLSNTYAEIDNDLSSWSSDNTNYGSDYADACQELRDNDRTETSSNSDK